MQLVPLYRAVGVRLGSGETLEEILGSMTQVAEGVATAGAVGLCTLNQVDP
jgi:glycerol-3-phosphate dehydrogenase